MHYFLGWPGVQKSTHVYGPEGGGGVTGIKYQIWIAVVSIQLISYNWPLYQNLIETNLPCILYENVACIEIWVLCIVYQNFKQVASRIKLKFTPYMAL